MNENIFKNGIPDGDQEKVSSGALGTLPDFDASARELNDDALESVAGGYEIPTTLLQTLKPLDSDYFN